MTVHRRYLKPPKSGLPATKTLIASKRAVLGSHTITAPMTRKPRKAPLRGEPHRFVKVLAPTHAHGPSGWKSARLSSGFKKVIASRKVRRTSIGHWRRGRRDIPR